MNFRRLHPLAIALGLSFFGCSGGESGVQTGKPGAIPVEKVSNAALGDQMILANLEKEGAKLEQPRNVRYFLYLPSEEAANALATRLKKDGYDIEVSKYPQSSERPWTVTANRAEIVNSISIKERRAYFEGLAAEKKGDFDGWEAAAKP